VNKSKPHYELEKVKSLIRAGQYQVTMVAVTGGDLLGFKRKKAIAECVLTLERSNFYKSMASDRDHKEWMDVYHAIGPVGKHIYTKFSVVGDRAMVRIISFKEK
jgi:motility quorum-sensing regulator/GCU-specific mRNA interferase toxin